MPFDTNNLKFWGQPNSNWIDPEFTEDNNVRPADRLTVTELLTKLYDGSLAARNMMDIHFTLQNPQQATNNINIVYDPARTATARGNAQTNPNASLILNPEDMKNLYVFTETGFLVQEDRRLTLAHELSHLLLDTNDPGNALEGQVIGNAQMNMGNFDYKGDAVRFENTVSRELGIEERSSYIGSIDKTSEAFNFSQINMNVSYTDGNHVDIVRVAVKALPGKSSSDNIDISGRDDGASMLAFGFAGNDTITGNSGADYLYGGFGTDTVYGGAGNDHLYGSDGSEGGRNEVLEEAKGDGGDKISGNEGDDHIYGGYGDDKLDGDEGNDSVYGGDGNDSMVGGRGNDSLWGDSPDDEAGTVGEKDLADYSSGSRPINITISDSGSSNLVNIRDGQGGTDDIHAIELIKGTNSRDTLKIIGDLKSDLVLTVDANGGQGASPRDTILMSSAASKVHLTLAGDGTGSLVSSGGQINLIGFHTSIVGSAFNDVIDDQSTGEKQIDGGAGDDTISVGGSGAMISGGDGFDTLSGGDGNDVIDGGPGINSLKGGGGSDLITSGQGSFMDTVLGGEGADYLVAKGILGSLDGGSGNDVIDPSKGFYSQIKFNNDGGHDVILKSPSDGNIGSYGIDFGSVSKHDVSFIVSNKLVITEITPPDRLPPQQEHSIDIPGQIFFIADLTIVVNSTGSTITIEDAYGSADYYGFTYDGLDDIRHQINVGRDFSFADGGFAYDEEYPVSFGDVSSFKTAIDEYAAAVSKDQDPPGTSGDDDLGGGGGDDTLDGGAGDDQFSSSGGDDRIEGGAGLDTLTLLGSADQFDIEFVGDEIILEDKSGPEGRLTLSSVENIYFAGSDVASTIIAGTQQSDVLQGDESVILYGNGGDDSLTGGRLDSKLFGGQGADVLQGGGGADHLEGNEGSDILRGGAGSDTYRWQAGDGNDTITDLLSNGETSILTLSSFRSADVSLAQDGNDLLLMLGTTGETIRVEDQFADGIVSGVTDIYFGGDSTQFEVGHWDRATIDRNFNPVLIQGTSGDDSLTGSDMRDIYIGGAGNDILIRSGGNDIYNWSLGDGSDAIVGRNESLVAKRDVISLSEGILPDDVTVRYSAAADDTITLYIGSSGSIDIDGVNADNVAQLSVEFADGSVWNQDTILNFASQNMTLVSGTSADDFLGGTGRNDLFDGKLGNDEIRGGSGSDEYIYRSGDGNDYIADLGDGPTDFDVIKLVGINLDQVAFSRQYDDVIMTDSSTGQTVTLHAQFSYGSIESIQFDDGSSIDSDTIANLASVISGTQGNDYIYGTDNFDIINGSTGDDQIYGYDGSDQYLYRSGDGNDFIVDNDSNADIDVVRFVDLGSNDVAFSRVDDDIVITDLTTSMKLTVGYQLQGVGIESIIFNDGVTLDRADIDALFTTIDGTSEAETLTGSGANDTIQGMAGDDALYGGYGDDTYSYSSGDGNDSIFEYGVSVGNRINFLNLTLDQISIVNSDENLILTDLTTFQTITVAYQFVGYGVDFMDFSNGVTLDRNAIYELASSDYNS